MRSRHKLKQAFMKCLLNYRIIFVYFMASSFLFMHYVVKSSSQQATSTSSIVVESEQLFDTSVITNFNSKKLLNLNYDLQQPQKRHHRKRRRRANLNNNNINARFVVNKLDIDAPSKLAYDLKNSSVEFYSQIKQDRILVGLLDAFNYSRSRHGVFVEAGAYDGETWSNTLHLERFRNWTGLLIEPSRENYAKLRAKNRKAHSINACLCRGESSMKLEFIEAGPFGTLSRPQHQVEKPSKVGSSSQITCHPLHRILNAYFDIVSSVNSSHQIDYLSLDIEGNEKAIVETFPWSKFRFSFVNIEFNQSDELYKWLKTFLGRFGYVETVVDDVWFQDIYLAHQSILDNNNNNNNDSIFKRKKLFKVSDFLN